MTLPFSQIWKNRVSRTWSTDFELFCNAFSSKLSQTKSILQNWNDKPPDWIRNCEWQLGSYNMIVGYLGMPFRSPIYFLKCEIKCSQKLKWNSEIGIEYLCPWLRDCKCVKKSCPRASFDIYYASTWFLAGYQINKVQKIIRQLLWFDGRGCHKKHYVCLGWCCINKM